MNNAFFAFFDFLGNLDLALSTEKGDGPHLAQVHAHWVARLADDIAVAIEFNFFFLLFFLHEILAGTAQGHPLIGIDDLDVHLAENRHNIVDLVGRDHFRWQHVVDIVIGQIAFFLPEIDELFDLLHIFFLHRLGGRVGGGLSLGYRTRAFGSSFRCSSWRSFRTRSCHSSILSLFAFSSFCSSATRILSRSSRFCALICLPFKRARQSAAILPQTASVRSSVSKTKRAISLASSAGKLSL